MEHILNDHELNKEGSTPTVCVKHSTVGSLHFSWTTLRPSVEVRRLRSGRRGALSKVLVRDTVCKACALFSEALWARHHSGAFFWGLCLAFHAVLSPGLLRETSLGQHESKEDVHFDHPKLPLIPGSPECFL